MRKIVAVFLAFMLMAVLAACGDDEPVTTTDNFLVTASTTAAQEQVSASPTDSNGNPTMVLTTQVGQTMPTVVTTAFDLAAEISSAVAAATTPTAIQTEPSFDFTVPTNMTVPSVNVSQIETSATSKGDKDKDENGENGDTDETDKNAQPEPVEIDIQGVSTMGDHKLEITFAADGWGNGIKSKTANVSVQEEDGTVKVVKASLSRNKDADGNYSIIIDTSALEQGTISFTIPGQFVESRNGLKYSSEYSGSASLSWDE